MMEYVLTAVVTLFLHGQVLVSDTFVITTKMPLYSPTACADTVKFDGDRLSTGMIKEEYGAHLSEHPDGADVRFVCTGRA